MSCPRRRYARRLLRLLMSTSLALAPGLAWAQAANPPAPPGAADQPQPAAPSADDDAQPTRFFQTVTVSSTLNPVAVKDTPGTVSVINAETIQRRLIENVADLVKFEPGVYIDTTVNRIGLNGFNIRGIGGNRVMTQVDGVETSEQFDFGPFNVHQFALDLDTLKTAEIVRSSGSSLYGSDALGGVVSFFTRDPADYLAGRPFHIAGKTLFDGRARDTSGNVVLAGGGPRVQASIFASYSAGQEPGNKGTVKAEGPARTALNPQARHGVQALGKFAIAGARGSLFRTAVEIADTRIETQAFSSRGVIVAGPTVTDVTDITSDDTMRRQRMSVDHSLAGVAGLNQVSWNLFVQNSDTGQVVNEVRSMSGTGPVLTVNRSGTLEYEQNSAGGGVQARKAFARGSQAVLFTFGGGYKHNTFDMIRDRLDLNAATGAVIPATNLILPSKYFPRSGVGETGVYLQAETRLGRLTLVPGLRYDRFSLDADASDGVYVATQSPAAADFKADATSARIGAAFAVSNALTLHAQYAGGFRAPPYSAVNSGFTNLQGGYTSVPNTELDAETSDNVEFGARTMVGPVSVGVTGFWNAYDNFILQAQRGLNPTTRLLEYQYQNVSKVEIRGVELQGEAQLRDGLRLRASYALIRGDDVSGPADIPLDSIAPDQGVVGLQYSAASNRWGSDLTVRAVGAQSPATAGAGRFAPAAFGVVDLSGWASLGHGVTLRGGVLNLTDTKYFEWPNVRGRADNDPLIDRYSSPGISGMVSLSYGW